MTRRSKEELEKMKLEAEQNSQEEEKEEKIKSFSGYFEESLMNDLKNDAKEDRRNLNNQVKHIIDKHLKSKKMFHESDFDDLVKNSIENFQVIVDYAGNKRINELAKTFIDMLILSGNKEFIQCIAKNYKTGK